MKILSRLLSILVIASLALVYIGCGGGGDDEDPIEKTQLAKLSSTWTISSVTLNGTPRTDFTGFTVTLTGAFDSKNPKGPYTYSVGGTRPNPNPWPATGGQWSFGASPLSDLIRHDADQELPITYTLTDSQLTLSFTYTGAGFAGSRTDQVEGAWVFTFTK